MGTPDDRQAPRANRLSILADAEGSRREPRSWPLPISLYKLVMLAAIPVVLFAWPLGLRGLVIPVIASGLVLVGMLLTRTTRWRPAGDTWRAAILNGPDWYWLGRPQWDLASLASSILVVGVIFVAFLVAMLAGN